MSFARVASLRSVLSKIAENTEEPIMTDSNSMQMGTMEAEEKEKVSSSYRNVQNS